MGLRGVLFVLLVCLPLPAQAASGSLWSVGEAGTTLRDAAALEAGPVADLAAGRRLIEFERQGPWLRVAVMGAVGLEGWVLAEDLEESLARRGGAEAVPEDEIPDQADQGSERRAAGESRFRLTVAGSPALAFGVECSLHGLSGKVRTLRYQGFVPKAYRFRGSALACLVSKQDARGRLEVGLSDETGTLATADTAAPFNYVRVRSAGPWGKAAGRRGAIPLVQVERTGPSRTVPFLPTPLIPPLRKP